MPFRPQRADRSPRPHTEHRTDPRHDLRPLMVPRPTAPPSQRAPGQKRPHRDAGPTCAAEASPPPNHHLKAPLPVEASGAASRSPSSATVCDGPPRARSRDEPAAPRRPQQKRRRCAQFHNPDSGRGRARVRECGGRTRPAALPKTQTDSRALVRNTKHNNGFSRFHRRGRIKVRLEWRLLMMSHNLTKVHRHQLATVAA
jgi:hypothetical protein